MSDTFDAPGSRNEAILQNMLGANNPLEPSGSRIEDLLQQLLEKGFGSGLPDVTSDDNGKVLGVENGQWGAILASLPVYVEGGAEDEYYFPVTSEQWSAMKNGNPFVVISDYATQTNTNSRPRIVIPKKAASHATSFRAVVIGETIGGGELYFRSGLGCRFESSYGYGIENIFYFPNLPNIPSEIANARTLNLSTGGGLSWEDYPTPPAAVVKKDLSYVSSQMVLQVVSAARSNIGTKIGLYMSVPDVWEDPNFADVASFLFADIISAFTANQNVFVKVIAGGSWLSVVDVIEGDPKTELTSWTAHGFQTEDIGGTLHQIEITVTARIESYHKLTVICTATDITPTQYLPSE